MQRNATLEVAHYAKGRAVRCSSFERLQALDWVWWYWGRKEEIKRTNQKRCGEEKWGDEKGGERNPHQIPSAIWTGKRKPEVQAGMRSCGPALLLCLGSTWWLPPTFLVSRVRGHMWVLGGLLDMEVHVVQLHVQADRSGWVTVHCGLETADWCALARTGRIF